MPSYPLSRAECGGPLQNPRCAQERAQQIEECEPAGQARARLAALGGAASAGKGVSMRQFFDPKTYPARELWNVSADGRYSRPVEGCVALGANFGAPTSRS